MGPTAPATTPLTCPFCEASDLTDSGRNVARCGACGGILGGDFLSLLRWISTLPNPAGRHACACGHPETRLLPDGVYRCPACGPALPPAHPRRTPRLRVRPPGDAPPPRRRIPLPGLRLGGPSRLRRQRLLDGIGPVGRLPRGLAGRPLRRTGAPDRARA